MKQIKRKSNKQLEFKRSVASYKFTVVGQVSEWICSKKSEIKYLKLANGSQQIWVKLSKKNRNNLEKKVILGCWLKVKIEKKLCLKTDLVRFKAKKIESIKRVIYPDRSRFKPAGDSQLSGCDRRSRDSQFCSQIEAGLQEHFRIRGNFRIKCFNSN
ncbi:MAG: hypothetical protein ACFBSE_11085 [Prochloraceae cyanobacterium]